MMIVRPLSDYPGQLCPKSLTHFICEGLYGEWFGEEVDAMVENPVADNRIVCVP